MNPNLRSVPNPGDLPLYPVPSEKRLDSHEFVAWEFRRFLASEMRWNGTHEVKSIWFDLVQMAHEQTPVGTLPMDHARLARMVQPPVDLITFEAHVARPYGVLYGWEPCVCDNGQMRLMHPKVTEVVMNALSRKGLNEARTSQSSSRRRIDRLAVTLGAVAPSIAIDPAQVHWVDQHIRQAIERDGNQQRTDAQLQAAINACFEKMAEGFFRKGARK